MQRIQHVTKLLLALGAFTTLTQLPTANAQAVPTATASLQFSVFGGVTGTYTGIALGRNLAVTAGADATFRPFFGVYPSVEIRGTYPVDNGGVDGQKNFLAGLRISKHIGRIHPYGDFLAGRDEIDYNPLRPDPLDTILYKQTASAAFAGGGGADILMSDHFAVKADFQFQHYDSPVTTSGAVYAKAFTFGIVYRLPFSGVGRRY